jgi:hypothetical protein
MPMRRLLISIATGALLAGLAGCVPLVSGPSGYGAATSAATAGDGNATSALLLRPQLAPGPIGHTQGDTLGGGPAN